MIEIMDRKTLIRELKINKIRIVINYNMKAVSTNNNSPTTTSANN